MKSPRLLSLLFVLLLLISSVASAGVRVSISDQLDPEAEVVVETRIRYAGFHGYHYKALGTDLIKAGENIDKTVWAVIPVFYDSVYANAFHPAYYIDSSRSEKTPIVLRTVQLPTLMPRSWARLLETGEPLKEGGVGITAGNVKDHFSMILRYFLPAFDRAGGKENLQRHLPLLEQMATFAHTPAATRNSQLNLQRFSSLASDDKMLASIKSTERRYRLELVQLLMAIKGWLALEQSERLPMYDWLSNLHNPEYVFDQVMDDADRHKVYALLKQSESPGHQRSAEWINAETRVKFTLDLDTRTGGKGVSGFRTSLLTDLNPRLGLERNELYSKISSPGFSNDAQKGWQLIRK